jgi:hypothetical protein
MGRKAVADGRQSAALQKPHSEQRESTDAEPLSFFLQRDSYLFLVLIHPD